MKTYLAKQHVQADTEKVTKYQLSRLYTKIDNSIISVSSALSSSIDLVSQNLTDATNTLTVNINDLSSVIDQNFQTLTNQLTSKSNEVVLTANTYADYAANTARIAAAEYTDQRISNLGSVYNLKGFYLVDGKPVSSILLLPSDAKKGDIYLIEQPNANNVIEIMQYVCVNENTEDALQRWQKFGFSIDLSKYATQEWVETRKDDSDLKIQQLSSVIDSNYQSNNNFTSTIINDVRDDLTQAITTNANVITSLSTSIDNNLVTTKEYTDTALLSAKSFTTNSITENNVTIIEKINSNKNAINDLSALVNDNKIQLSANIDLGVASGKAYTTESIANLINEYNIQKHQLIQSANAENVFSVLSANTTYKFSDVKSIWFDNVEDSDFESVLYITTNDEFTSITFPSSLLQLESNPTFEANKSYVVKVRNNVAEINRLK